MAAIERTAYPRFRRHLNAHELATLYTANDEEIAWTRANARTVPLQFALLVLLKIFQ